MADLEALRAVWPIERLLRRFEIDPGCANRISCPFCVSSSGREDSSFSFGEKWFKCYRCDAKGDVFALLMLLAEKSFSDAIKTLDKPARNIIILG